MLDTILNPNPLMVIGYLCFLGAVTAAAAIHLWNNSDTRQKWNAEESANRLKGTR